MLTLYCINPSDKGLFNEQKNTFCNHFFGRIFIPSFYFAEQLLFYPPPSLHCQRSFGQLIFLVSFNLKL